MLFTTINADYIRTCYYFLMVYRSFTRKFPSFLILVETLVWYCFLFEKGLWNQRVCNRGNVHQVFLLDLTAEYGVKTNAKLTAVHQVFLLDLTAGYGVKTNTKSTAAWESKTCLNTIFAQNFLTYILWCTISLFGTINTYPLIPMYFICLMDGRDSNSK